MSQELEIAYRGWDKQLDFEDTKILLMTLIHDTRNAKKKAFFATLLVQMLNAARSCEAVDAMTKWASNGRREQRVRAEKRKPNNKFMRLVIIPTIVRKYRNIGPAITKAKADYSDVCNYLDQWCSRHLGFNTHSLRYAGITHMSATMYPQEITRITGHTDMKLIQDYTNSRVAESKLRVSID